MSHFRARARGHDATAIARDPIGCYRGGMRRKPGNLSRYREQANDRWLASYRHDGPQRAPLTGKYSYPSRALVRAFVDEELAEIIAGEPGSKLGTLAASELRSREAWRGPARWSLIIAALAFAVSLAAFIRAGYS